MEPLFLGEGAILEYHARSLAAYGGADGIRDENGLRSAISAPQNVWLYQVEADLFLLAAAYAFHLAEAQAFVDGNKRTAVMAALAFLFLNGIEIDPSANEDLYHAMIAVAEKAMDRDRLAAFLRTLPCHTI